MWRLVLLFISLSVVSAEYEYEGGCSAQMFNKCERDAKLPDRLPENAEELQDVCNFVLTYFECATPIVDECDEEDFKREFFHEMRSLFLRLCDSDSPLHKALIEILPCLKRNGGLVYYCRAGYDEEKFEAALSSNGITDVADTVEEGPNECLRFLFNNGCLLNKLEESCGNLAKEFYLDVLLGLDSFFSKCRPGARDQITDIAKVVQSLKMDENDEEENEISDE